MERESDTPRTMLQYHQYRDRVRYLAFPYPCRTSYLNLLSSPAYDQSPPCRQQLGGSRRRYLRMLVLLRRLLLDRPW